jgi:hypothetical protein
MNSSAASPSVSSASGVNPLAQKALIAGIIGLAIGIAGIFVGTNGADPGRPLLGYLIGFAFWFAMAIGMLLLVIMFYLFDAGWPIVIRRQLEHCLAAVPWLALCFLPLLLVALGVFGHDKQGLLWRWLDPSLPLIGKPGETIAEDPLFIHKSGFLSLPFFLVRLAIYLTVLWGLSVIFRKNSFAMDRNPDASYVVRCRKFAAFGAFAVPLTLTFAAFDFFMSLSYTWFSTMYGVWFFATCMRCGIAGTIILCFYMSAKPGRPLYGIYNRAHQYLLGCLALTFTVFYAYVTFCQYFLIYNADIPEETFWFNVRELSSNWVHNSWWWVSLSIIFFYFFTPFFCLLSYHLKVNRRLLPMVAGWILCFLFLDLYFNILPGMLPDDSPANVLHYQVRGFRPQIWDIATLIGVGGICIWAYLRSQPTAETIPIHDPRIEESLNYHE